jgi:hypothetical protein
MVGDNGLIYPTNVIGYIYISFLEIYSSSNVYFGNVITWDLKENPCYTSSIQVPWLIQYINAFLEIYYHVNNLTTLLLT